jgi:MFS family permease
MTMEQHEPSGAAVASAQRLDGNFWRLFTGAGLTNIGDGLRLAALPLLAREVTSDPALVAGAASAAMAPWLLFSLPFGVVIDRANRKHTIVVANLLRAVGVLWLGLAIVTGTASIPVVYAAAFLLGMAEVLVDTASQAIVPSLVQPALLERANGRLYTADIVGSTFIGPPLGGFLFGIAAAVPFFGSIPLMLLAAVLVGSIKGSYRPDRTGLSTGPWRELKDGIVWLWVRPLFRLLAAVAGVTNFFLAAVTALLVVLARDHLGLGAFGFSTLLMVLAAGSVFGGLFVERVAERVHLSRVILLGLSSFACCLAVVGLSRNAVLTAGALFCIGIAVMLLNVVTVTLRQSVVPEGLLGRVTSVYRMVALGSIPAGAAVSGIVASVWGISAPFVLGALCLLALAGVTSRTVTRDVVDAARSGQDVPGA